MRAANVYNFSKFQYESVKINFHVNRQDKIKFTFQSCECLFILAFSFPQCYNDVNNIVMLFTVCLSFSHCFGRLLGEKLLLLQEYR